MKVVGFERMSQALDEEVGSAWIIPPRHSAQDLDEYRDLISKAEFSPPSFEDGETADQQVRRKTAPRRKVVYDDDEEDDGANDFVDDGDDALFPKNLPNKNLVGPDGDRPIKKRRIRRRKETSEGDDDELPTEEEDEIRAEKARKRRKRDLDKQRKIKSALFISPSDDESDAEGDAEFFRREEEIRQRVKKALAFAPMDISQLQESAIPSAAITETMKRLMADSGDEEEKSSADESSRGTKAASRKRKSDAVLVDDEDEDMSSPPAKRAAPATKKRGGFLVDSSDDEEEDEVMKDAESSSPHHITDDEDDTNAANGSEVEEMQTDDTPFSSNSKVVSQGDTALQTRSPLKEKDLNATQQDRIGSDDGEDDEAPVANKRRPRVNVGVVMSDSDEE